MDYPISPKAQRRRTPVGFDLACAFAEVLGDSSFLPDGGILGFQLTHEYSPMSASVDLADLRGVDRAVYGICERLGLATWLLVTYFTEEGMVYSRNAIHLDGDCVEGPLHTHLVKYYDASDSIDHSYPDKKLFWVTELTGNQVKVSHIWRGLLTVDFEMSVSGNLCLFVTVGELGSRRTA